MRIALSASAEGDLLDGFPFSIYYSIDGDVATVIAVLDSRQNPQRIRAKLSGFDM